MADEGEPGNTDGTGPEDSEPRDAGGAETDASEAAGNDQPAADAADAPSAPSPETQAADEATGSGGVPGAIASTLGGVGSTLGGVVFASKLRIALFVVLGLVGLVGAAFLLGVIGAPEVAAMQNDVGTVTNETTIIETNLTVHNPNPIGVSLGGVTADYQIRMNDVAIANGTKEGISIGTGNSTMYVETTLYNDRIPPWWASHVNNGERTTVVVDTKVSASAIGQSKTFTSEEQIQTDILGAFASEEDRPIDGNLPIVDDPLLIVKETDAAWGSASKTETPLNMAFRVYNPNIEPYAISELRYNVTMNDVLVAEGASEDPFVVTGGATNTLQASTAIQNQRLDEWWVSHLDESVYGHQVTRFRITFTAVIELPNGETTTVPLEELDYGEWIGTDIFDEGGDVGVPPEEAPDDEGGFVGGDGTSGDGTTDGDSGDGTNTTDGSGDDGSDDGGSDGGILGSVAVGTDDR
ncbi:hypothetical protein GCM10028857_25180 [Salinarchaeum chitinilyticum]